jgi:hypothetical protein
LPLPIPVFVRSRGENGKDFLELATAVDISAGGALLAVRRSLPMASEVLLEVPSPSLAPANGHSKASRILRARAVRVSHGDGFQLIAVKFLRPLVQTSSRRGKVTQRKVPSLV